jgi:hypothetical protein
VEPLERVSTRLPLPVVDKLIEIARKHGGISVSMVIRQLLVLRLK